MSFTLLTPAVRTLARRFALGAAALAFVSPVLAQPVAVVPAPPPEQIVIVGHYDRGGTLPDNVQSASLAVGYGDLDLSLPGDRDVLRHRIALTARYLCDRLGETDVGPGSCRDAATRDGLRRVGTIWEHAAPRGTAWVRPPAWTPPYPVAWVNQYP
ncbi:MAG: UrcA family protein [Sphingomicrobium sp.]